MIVLAAAFLLAAGDVRAQDDSYLDSLETYVDSAAMDVAPPMDTAPAAPAVLRLDTSHVDRDVPSAAVLARLREDDDFDYGKSYREPESITDAILRWISNWFRDMLGADGVMTFWDIVAYVILGASIIFVAFKLSNADTRALFFRRKDLSDGDMALLEEDVRGIDYPTQIERAIAAGDLRLAVRLHYLRLLRDLSERGSIVWRHDKTDAEYARELRGTPMQRDFDRAALLFEYVWYGDFPIDLPAYEKVAIAIDRVAAVRTL